MRLWPFAMLLGGCQVIFELDTPPGPPDGPPDTPPDGPACLMPSAGFTTFDTETADAPCVNLGNPNNDANTIVEVVNGELHLTPMADVETSSGGCLSAVPQSFDTGVFIEMIQPAMGEKEYLLFVARWEGSGGASTLARSGTDVVFSNESTELGRTPIDASSRWWRARPSSDGLAVIGEVSPDGRRWRTIGTDMRPAPSTVRFELSTGVFFPGHETVATTTIVGGINACP